MSVASKLSILGRQLEATLPGILLRFPVCSDSLLTLLVKHSPTQPQFATAARWQRWKQYWNRGVCLLILVNLVLVLFNLTYVPLRQMYLRYLPDIVRFYDPIKGIEPHPVTQRYLADIATLRSQVAQSELTSPATQSILKDLQNQSIALIEENPFLASGRVANFSRLKRRIQGFTGSPSAQVAFEDFWQADYLNQIGWQQADRFLTDEIEPLLQRNYFREVLPTGQYVDEFWRFDLFFIFFFGIELLLRTLIISRSQPGTNWSDALARRWYELPLILPFWRWLRILPAVVRLHRTRLINVEKLINQATREPAAYLSDRVSKYLIVRLISQTQASVKDGTLLSAFSSQPGRTSIGDPDKVDQITDRIVQLVVMRVMPTVKPDLEELLRHSLHRALAGSQIYDGLLQIPGVDVLPREALDNIADYLSQATCDVLADSYADEEGRILVDQLSYDFRRALGKELQDSANSEELQALLSDLLEEFKLNYIERSQQSDPENTLQEVDSLHQTVQSNPRTI